MSRDEQQSREAMEANKSNYSSSSAMAEICAPFVPAFAKSSCCTSIKQLRHVDDEIVVKKKNKGNKKNKKGQQQQPPVETVQTNRAPSVMSTLSQPCYNPLENVNRVIVDNFESSDDDEEMSIDFTAEFRREVEKAAALKGVTDLGLGPSSSQGNHNRCVTPSPAMTGRRLPSGKRLIPAPFPEEVMEGDSTFDDLSNSNNASSSAATDKARLGDDAAAGTAAAAVVLTAVKDAPHATAGVVFRRSKSSSQPSAAPSPAASNVDARNDDAACETAPAVVSTIISHLLPDGIFRDDAERKLLIGATVLSVNDIPVSNPRHAAEMVRGAPGEVKLRVVPAPDNGRKEIDLQLLRLEKKKLQEQLAKKQRGQQQQQQGPEKTEEDDDLNKAVDLAAVWSQQDVIQSAFPSYDENDDSDKNEDNTAVAERQTDDKLLESNGSNEEAALSVGRTHSRIPLLASSSVAGKAAAAKSKKSVSKQQSVAPAIAPTPKMDGKYVRIKSDDPEPEDGKREADDAKKKGKSSSRMRLRGAFGLRGKKKTRKNEGYGIMVPNNAEVEEEEEDAQKVIEQDVSGEDILNDLGSVRSSDVSKGSSQGEEEEKKEGNHYVEEAELEVEVEGVPRNSWSEGGKSSPAAAIDSDPDVSGLSEMCTAAECAASFVVESIVNNLSGAGHDLVMTNNRSMTHEEMIKFNSEASPPDIEGHGNGEVEVQNSDDVDEVEEEHAEEQVGASSLTEEDDTDQQVERALAGDDEFATAPLLPPNKNKGFLKKFRKKQKAKETKEEPTVVADGNKFNEEEVDNVLDKDGIIKSEGDEAAAGDLNEVDNTMDVTAEGDDDDDNEEVFGVTTKDPDETTATKESSFFKRAVFKKKSKKVASKSQQPLIEMVDALSQPPETTDDADADDNVVNLDANTGGRNSFWRKLNKKKKKRRGQIDDVVPVSDSAEEDVNASLDLGSSNSEDDKYPVLDITRVNSTGGVEVHGLFGRDPFELSLSPISSPARLPNGGKKTLFGSDGLPLEDRTGSNNDATASLSLESVILDTTKDSAATPALPQASGPDAALPPTPPTPAKVGGEGWDALFGQEDPPSPSVSIAGIGRDGNNSGDGDVSSPTIAVPKHQSFECRLHPADDAFAGRKEAVNVSMEVLEGVLESCSFSSTTKKSRSEPETPPPVNRKLNFECVEGCADDFFKDSLCKVSFRSRAVDVTTVYREEEEGVSFEGDGRSDLARTKQHAFDIIQRQSRSRRKGVGGGTPEHGGRGKRANGGGNDGEQNGSSSRVESLRKNLFPAKTTDADGESNENNVTIATADVKGEASTLLI